MAPPKSYRIKQVAQMVGVSVRTLHYYDEIDLLKPKDRSDAGYRLYDETDLLRLQQILIGRKLGLALEKIRKSLDEPDFDFAASLRDQRRLLVERIDETHKMIASIDRTLQGLTNDGETIDFKMIFDGFDPADYDEEVRARWDQTQSYAQSQIKTKDYTQADWALIKKEADEIWAAAADAMRSGVPPSSDSAIEIAERYRRHVCRWFYDLSPGMYVQLSEMWVNDPRFSKNIDKHADGLAAWLAPTIKAAAAAN